jgi:predicted metal-dependent hydrolase
MRESARQTILLNGRSYDYRLVDSATAKRLCVRVRPVGIEVLRPKGRARAEVDKFLRDRASWIDSQVERVRSLNGVRRTAISQGRTILLRGERLRVVTQKNSESAINRISLGEGCLTLHQGTRCHTPVQTTLTNWLRRQAREDIMRHLPVVCRRLHRTPKMVFIMAQRTKWGNCSAKHILSFNWRLILAPPFVLNYLVTHEAVHLAVPDHSHKFWLTVRSMCPDAEQARQWLVAHNEDLLVDLSKLC